MTKKTIITLVAILYLMTPCNLFSQTNYFGVSFMPQANWLATDFTGVQFGYTAGFIYNRRIDNHFSLEPNILFNYQRGSGICDYWYNFDLCHCSTFEKWYFVEIPVLLHYNFYKNKPVLSLFAGPQGNLLLKNISELDGSYHVFNLYFVSGIGSIIKIYKWIDFNAQFRFEVNITDPLPSGHRENNFRIGIMTGLLFGK